MIFFFFNDTATTEIYTLSLHDALPISEAAGEGINLQFCHLMINYDMPWNPTRLEQRLGRIHRIGFHGIRSEEHTSELQSRSDLVCRLLLEIKNNSMTRPSTS